mmetsp:Transcript_27052/g.62886  ORF Transcript_27052/g.62886 Transcript_27052/m.62886 type:complete len:102 (+) Transcript_27052:75-380(+)
MYSGPDWLVDMRPCKRAHCQLWVVTTRVSFLQALAIGWRIRLAIELRVSSSVGKACWSETLLDELKYNEDLANAVKEVQKKTKETKEGNRGQTTRQGALSV